MTDLPLFRDARQPIERRVEDLLARMTLPEKVGQMLLLNGQIAPVATVRACSRARYSYILNEELSLAMDAAAETRLGIPLLIGEDCIHGHSFHAGATIFRRSSGSLVRGTSRRSKSARGPRHARWRPPARIGPFHPVLCLSRDVRWGRTGETFGEDPFLIGEFGAAMIRGYQGTALDDPEGVLACASTSLATPRLKGVARLRSRYLEA